MITEEAEHAWMEVKQDDCREKGNGYGWKKKRMITEDSGYEWNKRRIVTEKRKVDGAGAE